MEIQYESEKEYKNLVMESPSDRETVPESSSYFPVLYLQSMSMFSGFSRRLCLQVGVVTEGKV